MLNGNLREGFRKWQLPRVKMLSRSFLSIASIIAFTNPQYSAVERIKDYQL
jgi:hypothetical protein